MIDLKDIKQRASVGIYYLPDMPTVLARVEELEKVLKAGKALVRQWDNSTVPYGPLSAKMRDVIAKAAK